ncbi:prepilin peptidase [Blastopirellula retiformator]|uniref:prepilin peptidase n=1 Tax=Blastopirellula retiformator TaxID=2527970 RepID=UPI001FEC035E|nr:prepilin peptidase [Blastopirellula retiformator]
MLTIATACDLRTREIPDWLSLALLSWGVIAKLAGWSHIPWLGMLVGGGIGLGLGLLLFYLGGLGGGDGKLITALGFAIGPLGLIVTLFGMALAGGVLAIVAKLRGQADYAYVPAILAGWFLCVGYDWFGARSLL